MSVPYRIIICDDQTLIRQSLAIVLERQPGIEVAGEAADGIEAVEQAALLRPDLILMDMRMPRMDGIEATRSIAQAYPDIKIVALTTFEEDELITGCLEAGAIGYLLKDLTPEELLKAIALIRSGESIVPASYLRKLSGLMRSLGSAEAKRAGGTPPALSSASVQLTEREREVLGLLLEGCSNKEISARLFLSETTVKNHLSSLFAKLDVRDRTQAVIFAVENGLHLK
ncbi:response regulator transcription factor [Paenibacillus elgii]|uniref:response regulator transcription factor n=1 Tax=Paenibacillus elgii TaxID=189691 RepID=UPI00203FE376|nr:response regulator transcription factor [Paenibacillus elgii]MCM3268499.1 response regulator transcription factor [Paenibacillus elgii]